MEDRRKMIEEDQEDRRKSEIQFNNVILHIPNFYMLLYIINKIIIFRLEPASDYNAFILSGTHFIPCFMLY